MRQQPVDDWQQNEDAAVRPTWKRLQHVAMQYSEGQTIHGWLCWGCTWCIKVPQVAEAVFIVKYLQKFSTDSHACLLSCRYLCSVDVLMFESHFCLFWLCCDQVTKTEKEIMRPLYNRYRALKRMITTPSSVITYFVYEFTDCHSAALLTVILHSHTVGRGTVY